MNNPFSIGDRVAYLSLDADGLRADRGVVRGVDGMDVLVSPADERAAAATTRVTVNDYGIAAELEPLTPEVERDMGTKDYAVYPFTQEPSEAEREELNRRLTHDRDEGMGHGY